MRGAAVGKKRIGIATAVAGLVFIILYPYLNYAGAHRQAEEFLGQNPRITRTSYSLFRGDLKPDGDYEHLVLDNSTDKVVKEHLILEFRWARWALGCRNGRSWNSHEGSFARVPGRLHAASLLGHYLFTDDDWRWGAPCDFAKQASV
jgi:hypothetical protein